jgi:hypothetical protein
LKRSLCQFPGRFCAPATDRAIALDQTRAAQTDERRQIEVLRFGAIDQPAQHLDQCLDDLRPTNLLVAVPP